MPYKIKSVSVQGIRGFNKPEVVPIGEGITLLYGQNGSGKSSLLQSIEWAMTGQIPDMKGGDFAREDAIVNIFNKAKKALVEVSLESQDSEILLKRSRKMGTRTTSGKQPFELELGEGHFVDEEAQAELEKALKVNMESFSQTKYLHQETIREILHAKPEERSQAIDKLLGTFEVREFAKSLDIDRQIKASSSYVQNTIESLKRDKVQFLINLQRSLDKTKDSLLKKGYSEQELTAPFTVNILETAKDEIQKLNETYGRKFKSPLGFEINSQSLSEAHRAMLSHLNELDRARLEAINKINSRKISLKSDSTRYSELCSQFQGIKQTDTTAIKERIEKIGGELKETNSTIIEIRQKLTTLPHKRNIFNDANTKLKNQKEKLTSATEEYGTIEDVKKKIAQGESELKKIQADLDKLSGKQQLITLAINHIEAAKPDECPICSRSIDNKQLASELRSKISAEIANSITELKQSEKKIKSDRRAFDRTIEDITALLETVNLSEKALKNATDEMQKLVPNFEASNLDDVVREWESKIAEISKKESELRGEKSTLNDTLTRFSQIQTEINRLQKQLQKEASTEAVGSDLVKLMDEITAALDLEITKYSDSSNVDSLRKDLSALADILSFIRDQEQVTAAEKELPLVEKQIADLESRITQLQALSASLQSIRQIAVDYEKEASVAQLRRLEEDINRYYSKIQGHPHFARLKIDIEKEDPLIFSIRAASQQEDTYIPTRFSTAQLNSVALSIFMSYSTQQTGEFPIMIFDDPTQNMDTAHKESFAKLVATLLSSYQMIIATEDGDTRRFLEKHCSGIKTYELNNWTPEGAEIKVA